MHPESSRQPTRLDRCRAHPRLRSRRGRARRLGWPSRGQLLRVRQRVPDAHDHDPDADTAGDHDAAGPPTTTLVPIPPVTTTSLAAHADAGRHDQPGADDDLAAKIPPTKPQTKTPTPSQSKTPPVPPTTVEPDVKGTTLTKEPAQLPPVHGWRVRAPGHRRLRRARRAVPRSIVVSRRRRSA